MHLLMTASEITRVWREYDLERRTRLSTPVTSVRRAKPQELDDVDEGTRTRTLTELKPGMTCNAAADDLDTHNQGHGLWVINNDVEGGGVFDTVVVTVGTCGKPRWIGFPGMPSKEEIKHRREASQNADASSDDVDETGANGTKDEKDTSESNTPEPYPPVHKKHTQKGSTHKREDSNSSGTSQEETFAGLVLHSSEMDDAPRGTS